MTPQPPKDCVICRESIAASSEIVLPCKHAFHKECLIEWIKQAQGKHLYASGYTVMNNLCCPTCRNPFANNNIPDRILEEVDIRGLVEQIRSQSVIAAPLSLAPVDPHNAPAVDPHNAPAHAYFYHRAPVNFFSRKPSLLDTTLCLGALGGLYKFAGKKLFFAILAFLAILRCTCVRPPVPIDKTVIRQVELAGSLFFAGTYTLFFGGIHLVNYFFPKYVVASVTIAPALHNFGYLRAAGVALLTGLVVNRIFRQFGLAKYIFKRPLQRMFPRRIAPTARIARAHF